MTKTKFCKKCGIELSKENCYSRSAIRFKPYPYCKTCFSKYYKDYYKKNDEKIKQREAERRKNDINRKFFTQVRRGKFHRAFRIEFKTFHEKHDFIIGRRLQARWGRCHASTSSKVGQSITVYETKRTEDSKVVKVASNMLCDDVKDGVRCNGIVRTNKDGFKECEKCGVIQDIYEDDSKVQLTYGERIDESSSDEKINCCDIYYCQAYAKVLK